MKFETHINVRGVSGDTTYGFERSSQTEIDEDFNEFRARVHSDIDYIFDDIERSADERDL